MGTLIDFIIAFTASGGVAGLGAALKAVWNLVKLVEKIAAQQQQHAEMLQEHDAIIKAPKANP